MFRINREEINPRTASVLRDFEASVVAVTSSGNLLHDWLWPRITYSVYAKCEARECVKHTIKRLNYWLCPHDFLVLTLRVFRQWSVIKVKNRAIIRKTCVTRWAGDREWRQKRMSVRSSLYYMLVHVMMMMTWDAMDWIEVPLDLELKWLSAIRGLPVVTAATSLTTALTAVVWVAAASSHTLLSHLIRWSYEFSPPSTSDWETDTSASGIKVVSCKTCLFTCPKSDIK